MQAFARSQMLLGKPGMDALAAAHVAVFGVGGVGSFAAEALARAGIGTLTLVDHDVVSASNLNRQLVALHSTLGQPKVEAMRARALDIHPQMTVHALPLFYAPENAADIDLAAFDYIVDAIDTVSSKVHLIVGAKEAGTPIVSCMGAGNRLDPTRFEVVDLWSTRGCPLARALRKELRARGVGELAVVHSTEPPRKPLPAQDTGGDEGPRRAAPGSVPFVPPVAGMIAAGVAVRGLAGLPQHDA